MLIENKTSLSKGKSVYPPYASANNTSYCISILYGKYSNVSHMSWRVCTEARRLDRVDRFLGDLTPLLQVQNNVNSEYNHKLGLFLFSGPYEMSLFIQVVVIFDTGSFTESPSVV
jgi:hypothetical protein